MKRRSARPFTVEIKHTRTSRAPLTEATARSRKGQDLWGNLPIAAADKPAEVQAAPLARSEPARVELPARRVLPSLVPMFAMPVEPETSEVTKAPAEERLPRVRRVKPPAKRTKILANADVATPVFDEAQAQQQATPAAVTPALAAAFTVFAQPAVAQARTARRTQQAATLRPGERRKRRLPRVLW